MTSDKTPTLVTPQCHLCTHFPVPARPVAPCAIKGYLVVPSIDGFGCKEFVQRNANSASFSAANSENFEVGHSDGFSYQRRSSTADRSHLRDFDDSLRGEIPAFLKPEILK